MNPLISILHLENYLLNVMVQCKFRYASRYRFSIFPAFLWLNVFIKNMPETSGSKLNLELK